MGTSEAGARRERRGEGGSLSGRTESRRPRGTAKDRALRLLGVRWRSRVELERRLRLAGFEAEEIASALADLESSGLVEDSRFARELVRDQAGRRLAGDWAIRAALRQKGVAPEVADAAIAEQAGTEADRAEELARRRLTRMGGVAPEVAARRVYGLLLRRGYSSTVAAEACRRAQLEAGAEGGDEG